MDYVGQIIRPPSEAGAIILQVSVGCSHNSCTFCGAYKEKRFQIKDPATISADLDFAAAWCGKQSKIFLADGDALIIPFHRLESIFLEIRNKLPWVRRISTYGTARAIRSKSVEQLSWLQQLGLHRVYLGLESGSDRVLQQVCKGETAKSMIAAAAMVRAANLFLSVTVLLGLAGTKHSQRHAKQTAEVLSAMRPQQIAALTLLLMDNTPLAQACRAGRFQLPDSSTVLAELRTLIADIDTPCQFHANHASTYLPLGGRLPRDRQKILSLIDQAQADSRLLVPDHLRRL
ncbi:MAG: radical SAM protein [Desulfopila sp.]